EWGRGGRGRPNKLSARLWSRRFGLKPYRLSRFPTSDFWGVRRSAAGRLTPPPAARIGPSREGGLPKGRSTTKQGDRSARVCVPAKASAGSAPCHAVRSDN